MSAGSGLLPDDAGPGQGVAQLVRKRRGERQPLARERVLQGEAARMEEHPLEAHRGPRPAVEDEVAIFRIPHDRVADGGEVAADLVGAPGLDAYLEERRFVPAGELREV